MNEDELWAAIDDQRLRTVALLETLGPDDWTQPSLCDGWSVRDVAAHLTLQQLTLGLALRGMVRHPGGVSRVTAAMAKDRAALPVEELIARIAAMVGSRRHNLGVTPYETLVDIVVHGQDIAVPLGRLLGVPPATAIATANHLWAYKATAKGRLLMRVFRPVPYESFRLVATDVDWSVGAGPEVRGPVLSIVLAMTGRPAGLSALSGEGTAALSRP